MERGKFIFQFSTIDMALDARARRPVAHQEQQESATERQKAARSVSSEESSWLRRLLTTWTTMGGGVRDPAMCHLERRDIRGSKAPNGSGTQGLEGGESRLRKAAVRRRPGHPRKEVRVRPRMHR